MRVVAFWAALAGFAAAAAHATLLVAPLLGMTDGPLLQTTSVVAGVGQAAFTLLAGLFLLIVAVTDRKV